MQYNQSRFGKSCSTLFSVTTFLSGFSVFVSGGASPNSVIRIFRITGADGKNYNTNHYNLSAIIAEGYKVNSERVVQFRKWATTTDREILQDAGRVTAEIAKAHAESEFEKYRIIQDRLFESDFDRLLKQLEHKMES
jgi:hypothetical protein